MPLMKGVFVVIPAHNEGPVLGEVLDGIASECSDAEVVVVDDGSTDDTFHVARERPVHVIQHAVNLGQGAALRTGFDYALARGAEILITFDADGQMSPNDISRLVEPIVQGRSDVVLGTRFASTKPEGMRTSRKILLKLALVWTRLTTRLPFSDVHNGLRAFSSAAARSMSMSQDRMAHASELLHEIVNKRLRWEEVPVLIRYTEYSRRKGQTMLGAVDILADLFWRGRH
jgi:glycosyltransferase involved in cell wall biosynthesis